MSKKSKPNRSYYRRMGRDAFNGAHRYYSDNPFPSGTFEHQLFQEGWDKAKNRREEESGERTKQGA